MTEKFNPSENLIPEDPLEIARRHILGQIERRDFPAEYLRALALEAKRTMDETEFAQRADILSTVLPQGSVDPLTVPDAHKLRSLNEEDWHAVANHEQPIMAIWSKARLHQVRIEEKLENEVSQGRLIGDEQQQFRDISLLASLPLLHGTTSKGLQRILKSGQIYSHRAVNERSRRKIRGSTIAWDRELGLDNYVFADFGIPSTYQNINSEVTIAISPLALTQSGSFLTEKDIIDCNRVTEYFAGLSLPEDFYETALRCIRSSPSLRTYRENGMELPRYLTVPKFARGDNTDLIIGSSQQRSFSTWEVKIPEVPVEFIDKVIFKDQSQYRRFVAKQGKSIQAIYWPELKEHMEILQDPKIKAEVHRRLVANDYHARWNFID